MLAESGTMRRLLRSWSEQWKTRRVGGMDKCREERHGEERGERACDVW